MNLTYTQGRCSTCTVVERDNYEMEDLVKYRKQEMLTEFWLEELLKSNLL
jgi:hypothetical protein